MIVSLVSYQLRNVSSIAKMERTGHFVLVTTATTTTMGMHSGRAVLVLMSAHIIMPQGVSIYAWNSFYK